jgi:hypothetical protein
MTCVCLVPVALRRSAITTTSQGMKATGAPVYDAAHDITQRIVVGSLEALTVLVRTI